MLSTDALISRLFVLNNTGSLSREERTTQTNALVAEWTLWLAEENNISHLPDTVQGMVYGLAYEHGHASGYSEIAMYYQDFAELAALAAA